MDALEQQLAAAFTTAEKLLRASVAKLVPATGGRSAWTPALLAEASRVHSCQIYSRLPTKPSIKS